MQSWQIRLRDDFAALNTSAQRNIENLAIILRNQLTSTKCGKCKVEALDSDIVKFKCPGTSDDAPHVICFDCLSDKVERHRGYIEREHESKAQKYPALRDVVLCHECHCPHVVTSQTVFETGFDQMQVRNRGRREYRVDAELTDAIQRDNNYRVHMHFENQRRGMFSKFSSDNIGWRDTRTCTSDEADKPIKLTEVDRLADASEIWLEGWSYDVRHGDPQGWCYAFDWPSESGKWTLSATFTTFVRRRRMLRASIKLGNHLKKKKPRASGGDEGETHEVRDE